MPHRRPVTAAVITQDEPFVIPLLLRELMEAKADRIAAVFIADDPRAEGPVGALRRWGAVLDPLSLVRYGVRYLGAKLSGAGPARVARRYGVPAGRVADVNAPDFLQRLREMQVDLVISAACPQILREEILDLPALGCINVHSAPLPRYRGMLPTFWVLLHGEDTTAVTVHMMNEDLDDGPIIVQKAVPIHEDETQASLMRRCKVVGGRLLAEAIDLFDVDGVQPRPNPREEATYFSFPTAEQAREFRARGNRWT